MTFDDDDLAVIRRALFLAADVRLTDMTGVYGYKISEVNNFRDRCHELIEDLTPQAPRQ